MQGFAVIDNQPGSDVIAVWLTSRITSARAEHTNAVTLNVKNDPDAYGKVHSLTRLRAVVLTEGSTAKYLPVSGDVLKVADLDALLTETSEQQALIAEAVDTRKGNLVQPEFPPAPEYSNFKPAEDTASQRAFQTANFLAHAWTAWLATDEQRRRRSARMPESMRSTEVAEFPPSFGQRIHAQPL